VQGGCAESKTVKGRGKRGLLGHPAVSSNACTHATAAKKDWGWGSGWGAACSMYSEMFGTFL